MSQTTAPSHLLDVAGLIKHFPIKSNLFGRPSTVVRAVDFFDQVHGTLFATLMDMHDRNKAIDEKLLVARLKETGKLDLSMKFDANQILSCSARLSP